MVSTNLGSATAAGKPATPGITVSPTSGLVTTEAGGTATFTVKLNTQPTANVTIGLSSSDLTEGTVSPASLTFTSSNWSTTQTVTVTGVDDALVDGNVAYTIVTATAASTDAGYNGLNPSDVSASNTDNDGPGITVSPTSGLVTTEAGGTATFTVKLNTQPTANVTIGLSSSDLTEGTVSAVSLTFTTTNWNTAQTVTVTGVDDAIVDGNIAYTIVTAAATSADAGYNGLNAADVSASNTDNDGPGITVSPTSGLVTTEAGGTATFTVKLNSQPTANVTIGLSSSDLTEGTVSAASLTFTSANWSTAQTVTVTGVDDAIVDGNIAYTIVTAAATSSDRTYKGLNPADVSASNTDNDGAVVGFTVSPTSGLVTTEAGGTATFTVRLNTQPTANVTIGLSSSDLTEGTVSPASLTFTSANWSTTQTVTVTGVDDALVDGNIAYTIVTAAAASTDAGYNGLNPADVSASNTDNDVPGFTVSPTSGLVTTEAGGTATFTVRLNTQPTANVTIGLSSSDLTEGTVSPASLTFTSANWSTTQTATVTGVDDLVADGNIAYTVVTAAATSTDAGYNGLNPADVSASNTENDVAGFTVSPTSGLVTTEVGGTATFTVKLTSQPTANVTIGLSSSDLAEGTVSPASLTFTSANWSTTQTVTVTGVDDAVVDGNIAYTVVTAAATSTDAGYNGLNPADVSVSNTDNDVAGFTVSPTSGLVTTEAGGTATFTVKLNIQPIADVAIGLSSSDLTEGTVSPASLTFTSANWSTTQTVTVTGVDDAVADGNIAYTVVTAAATSTDPGYNGLDPADVSVSNTDNDVPGVGALVTWQDRRGATADIYAQRLDGSGASQWVANGLPVCAAAADQLAPVIQADPTGGALIAWTDARTGAAGADVYAQHVGTDGAMQWTPDGVRLCDAAGDQDAAVATADGTGGALVVWRDRRSTYADLYGQQVYANGQVNSQCITPDTLHDSIPEVMTATENYRYFRNLNPQGFDNYYWAGIGVRGDVGSDWDIEGYDQDSYGMTAYPSCFGNSLAGSYSSSGVDFVMFDENENHTPRGTYGIRVSHYSGVGTGTAEFDGGPDVIVPATNAEPWHSASSSNWTGVLDVYDISLIAGVTYTFDLVNTTGADVRAYLFSSVGASDYYYVVPKSFAVLETHERYKTFVAPANAYYGVAVTNETGLPTSYTLKIWSETPAGAQSSKIGDAPGISTGIQGVSPNPAGGAAQISFTLREGADVSFDVLDMAGRVVSKIPSRRWEAGAWRAEWDGRSAEGRPLSPGMYFVRMLAGGRRIGVGRVALIR